MSRIRLALALAALTCLGLAGTSDEAAAQTVSPITVVGRVVMATPAGVEPVPCCDVSVTLTSGSGGAATASARTDRNGNFSALLQCFNMPPFIIEATAECCGAVSAPQTIDSCLDPGTGGPRTVDVGDIVCTTTPMTGRASLQGSVVCRSGLFLEPVADCGILIRDASGPPIGTTRTDAAGDWDYCVDCATPTMAFYVVESLCCGLTQDVPVVDCPLVQPVATFVCDDCPEPPCANPGDVEIRGSVVCPPDAGGLDPEPWAGCPVIVSIREDCNGILLEERTVVTEADGTWSFCRPCPADTACPTWTVSTLALCCPAQTALRVDGCPDVIELPPAECDAMSCAGLPSCAPDEKQVRGRVTCFNPLFPGGRQPLVDCEVVVEGQGCLDTDGDGVCDTSCPTVTAFTDGNGDYSVCLPCAECTGVIVTATCCGAVRTESLPVDCGTTTVVDLDCTDCGATGGPCGPNARQVSGFVRCPDATAGGVTPVPGCGVRLTCPGSPDEVIAWTDEDGFYSACLDCLGCDTFIAEVLCCGAIQTVSDPSCSDVRQDFDCGSCDGILGRCPGEPAVRASGEVRCVRGAGTTPMAGCDVTLVGMPASGGPPVTVLASTDGTGHFEACVPCVDNAGLASITATAECCGASTTTPVDGCPVAQELLPLDCDGCSPCPDGFTRLQGRVHCRGAGAVEDCPVRVVIETCDGLESVELTTDSEGKYSACVPCPCPGTSVRITALCCGASRSIPVDDCGPVTPIPTLLCPVPCR